MALALPLISSNFPPPGESVPDNCCRTRRRWERDVEAFPETRKVVALTFALLLTLGAMACGQDGTPTPPPGPTLPTSQELRQAGDELFSAFSAAVQSQDGAAFHELLVAPPRERCTVEQVQGAVAGDLPFLHVDVKAVFLDLENPSRGPRDWRCETSL